MAQHAPPPPPPAPAPWDQGARPPAPVRQVRSHVTPVVLPVNGAASSHQPAAGYPSLSDLIGDGRNLHQRAASSAQPAAVYPSISDLAGDGRNLHNRAASSHRQPAAGDPSISELEGDDRNPHGQRRWGCDGIKQKKNKIIELADKEVQTQDAETKTCHAETQTFHDIGVQVNFPRNNFPPGLGMQSAPVLKDDV